MRHVLWEIMSPNPFSIHQYISPDYFCDRERELSSLIEAFDNHRYITLFSMRRLGKTGLIHHFHHHLRRKRKTMVIYCDVQNTDSDEAFVKKLVHASLISMEKTKKGLLRRVGDFFSSLRPSITFDPYMNTPSIDFNITDQKQAHQTLDVLVEMLGSQDKRIQISIDEFQQIARYGQETAIDATLRGYQHRIPNVHFLFSGSQKHLLLELFTNAQRPFFNATDQQKLEKLDPQVYADFIHKRFEQGKQKIETADIEKILDWTAGHTFYTQYFCNRLYSKRFKEIGHAQIELIKDEIIYSFEPNYLQLRAILSGNQWKILAAIANEGHVSTVSERSFLNKYEMAQSSAVQALGVLLERELLYKELTPNNDIIFLYDPFLRNWLRRLSG